MCEFCFVSVCVCVWCVDQCAGRLLALYTHTLCPLSHEREKLPPYARRDGGFAHPIHSLEGCAPLFETKFTALCVQKVRLWFSSTQFSSCAPSYVCLRRLRGRAPSPFGQGSDPTQLLRTESGPHPSPSCERTAACRAWCVWRVCATLDCVCTRVPVRARARVPACFCWWCVCVCACVRVCVSA